ncbi:hypothetical protein [Polaribacter sp. SA4-10]|uniref:hypothetical protein n=1 Tax=Polaribacter sp. SA4-10 TaxID=754397 RepID=UPI0012FBE4B2|nr:hypothetical protein [Polaribacter sp. SA4-10]
MSKKAKDIADENRYKKINYKRKGNSGLLLPEILDSMKATENKDFSTEQLESIHTILK